MSDSNSFQVNLRGVIDLLSEHLYSTPRVFVRELLQNATDAINARRRIDADHIGEIRLELTPATTERPATLAVTDNGIGLTEAEVHRFLATIGESSKRGRGVERPQDFIGQFGIGLLSGFLVADEIVVITRSAREDAATVEWRGRADGTYDVRTIDLDIAPGTQVYYTARDDRDIAELFTPRILADTARHYGLHLPIDIVLSDGTADQIINEPSPWASGDPDETDAERRDRLLAYGRELFESDFLDAIPLHSAEGGVEGVAFVLPFSMQTPTRQSHHAYLKGMLVSDHADDLLPPWAFFVRCVVNATELRPTASREAFYDDSRLAAARFALGECLRRYLLDLARRDQAMLDTLLAVHYLPMKALAADDDEFYRIIVDHLPFQTTLGRMRLGDIVEITPTVRYAPTVDQFQQIASVAAAQNLCVVNAGYAYDQELLEKLPQVFANRSSSRVEIDQLVESFEALSIDERESTFDLVKLAEIVLQPYRCGVGIQKFEPTDLPTLYTSNDASNFLRSLEQTREDTDDLYGGILDSLADQPASMARAQLTLNFNNKLIRSLAKFEDRNLVGRAIEMLYVQSLLLGRHPLGPKESSLLGEGLLGLIEYAMGE